MTAPYFVGVDVSKDHLDVHLRPQAETFRVRNDPEGIAAFLGRRGDVVDDVVEQV